MKIMRNDKWNINVVFCCVYYVRRIFDPSYKSKKKYFYYSSIIIPH